ncbi:hypothetical protein BDW71DRAFT_212410 [Aspergillus fruticulosus]
MPLWKRKTTGSDDTVTSAINLTLRQSLLPNALITILFFLWGFAYGLQALYLGAYFLCPLTVPGWLVRRFGFRVTFDGPRHSRGRLPALLAQWGQEIVWGILREHVVGAGLSPLETAAKPFFSICCPPRYSEIRLNFAQDVQGVGTFVAAPPCLARLLRTHARHGSRPQGRAMGLPGGRLLRCPPDHLVHPRPFPEITDADQQALEGMITDGGQEPAPLRKQYNLFLGVWSQSISMCTKESMDAHRNTATNVDVAVGKDIEMERGGAERGVERFD